MIFEVYAVRAVIPGSTDPWRAPVVAWKLTRDQADTFEFNRRVTQFPNRKDWHRTKGFSNVVKMHMMKIDGKWYRVNALPTEAPELDKLFAAAQTLNN
jgi:hypothetical protein